MVNNQELNDHSFLGSSLYNSSEHFLSRNGCSRDLEFSPLEGFLVEVLSPSKMFKVHSILESMEIRLIKGNEKGLFEDKSSGGSSVKVHSRRKNKPFRRPNGLF